jgi:hypothetical protein
VASGVDVSVGGEAGRDRSVGTGDTASCLEISGVLAGVTSVKLGGSGARLFMRRRKVPFTEKCKSNNFSLQQLFLPSNFLQNVKHKTLQKYIGGLFIV